MYAVCTDLLGIVETVFAHSTSGGSKEETSGAFAPDFFPAASNFLDLTKPKT